MRMKPYRVKRGYLLSTMRCVKKAVWVHKSAQHVCTKCPLCSYLVHGVLGDDLECPQGNPQVHEHDRNGPQSNDCQDAHKWVDPYCSSSNTQLKRGHTQRVWKLAKAIRKNNCERAWEQQQGHEIHFSTLEVHDIYTHGHIKDHRCCLIQQNVDVWSWLPI